MGRNKNDDMVCDVCGCITGHMTLKKPPERPADECQRCYWTRELTVDGLKVERDAAIARAEKAEHCAEQRYRYVLLLEADKNAAERARDELGIQLAAQSERLRLAMAVVDAARKLPKIRLAGLSAADVLVRDAIAALDAVPGDALPPSPAGASGQPSEPVSAAYKLAHLEASGIDTDNVRWVGPDGEVER